MRACGLVLAAALVAGGGRHRPPDPGRAVAAGKTLSIEVTIGTVRIEGWDRPDARNRGRTPRADRRRSSRACRSPSTTRRRASAFAALQTDSTTDPALRADVTVRVPRDGRHRSRAGARRPHRHRRLSAARSRPTFAAARSTARTCRERCGSRPASARSSLTDARLIAERPAAVAHRSTATCGCRWPSARPMRASWRWR